MDELRYRPDVDRSSVPPPSAGVVDVAAVIVTRNRPASVLRAISAVLAQSHPLRSVVVVDNASTDGTPDVLRDVERITYVRSDRNDGYAAGLRRGIEAYLDATPAEDLDAFWLLDDDTEPGSRALAELLAVADRVPGWGLVGMSGARLGWTGIHHLGSRSLHRRPLLVPGARQVDAVLVDGALLSLAALRAAGPPRADFFMMLEDMELSWRVGRAGFTVATLEEPQLTREHLGATAGGHWRKYYLSRNHVRWAIESRSPRLISGCVARQAKLLVAAMAAGRERRQRVAAHLRGVIDGLRGRMGPVVQPGEM